MEPQVRKGFCFPACAGLRAPGGHRKAGVGAWFSPGLTGQLLLSPGTGYSLATSSLALFEVVELTSEMFSAPPVKSAFCPLSRSLKQNRQK